MAVSQKDWELPNSRIWSAEIDIESGLDFPILTGNVLGWKSCKLKCKNIDYFHLTTFIYGSAKKADEKKSKEDMQTLAEVSSASTNHLHQRIKLFLFAI